jgi:hypothetical protein
VLRQSDLACGEDISIAPYFDQIELCLRETQLAAAFN